MAPSKNLKWVPFGSGKGREATLRKSQNEGVGVSEDPDVAAAVAWAERVLAMAVHGRALGGCGFW